MTSIMWFRRDLRLRDNPALREAAGAGPVLGLFVLDPALWGNAGPARRAWLAANLRSLDDSMDGRLCIRIGPAPSVVPRMLGEVGRRPAARHARLHPLRPQARPRRGRGAARRGRGDRDRHAVRRGAGDDQERVGRSLQGVHAVQQGVARARMGRPGPGAAQRRVGRAPTSDKRVAGDARQGAAGGARRDADTRRGRCAAAVPRSSSSATSTSTTTSATTPAPTARRGCRRTSSSG